MVYYRDILKKAREIVFGDPPRIVVINGLRQTGKTTLARSICEGKEYKLFNFELVSDRQVFLDQNRHSLEDLAREYKNQIVILDEIQKLPEATSIIKHLFDNYKIRFILTGSSEYKIKRHFGDSLIGRTRPFCLYPLSLKEILVQNGKAREGENLDSDDSQVALQRYLVYGSLPEIFNLPETEVPKHLINFVNTLLSKDILEISQIRQSTKIYSLAKFLAMQIGQLVNVNELANLTEMNRMMVYNYIDILEQLNLIVRAHPVSTNEREAISEKFKVYFTDLGLRNALINNFSSLNNRLDIGPLVENAAYLGIKRNLDNNDNLYKIGFFRSKIGTEIDIVVQTNGMESLFEVKASDKYMNKQGNIKYITMGNLMVYC